MNLLDELFLKYGTDKSSKKHNFASETALLWKRGMPLP